MMERNVSKKMAIMFVMLFVFGLLLAVEVPPVQAAWYNCYSQTAIPPIECKALVALYNSTDGAGWNITTNKWLVGTDPCAWYGVACTAGSVTAINLSDNNLIGTLPASLGNLPSLTHLQLPENQLSGSIPTTVGNLINLSYLSLFDNQFSGALPNQLGSLISLTTAYLDRNQFSGTIPASLGNLASLTTLWLQNNQFSGALPVSMSNLFQLKNLNFENNQLTFLPHEFGNLVNLTHLTGRNNPLQGDVPLSFINLTSLVFYDFRATYLCEMPDSNFQNWKAGVTTFLGTGICQTIFSRSSGGYDGKITESSETSNVGDQIDRLQTTFSVGDTDLDQQVKSILHFNTGTVPDTAVVTRVSLRLKASSFLGTNPFSTHGFLIVDIDQPYFSTSAALQSADFQDTASLNVACTLAQTASGWYLCRLKADAFQYINLDGYTQLRLRFQTGDNDNMIADLLNLYSGDVATANLRPILSVKYYIP